MILSGPISPNLVSHIAKLRNRKERKRKLIAGYVWFDGQTDIRVIYPKVQRKCSKDPTSFLTHITSNMMQDNSGEREPQFFGEG